MARLQELIAQKQALERQIEQAQRAERAEAIARVQALMSEHGLTMADLGARAPKATRAAVKQVPAKYRDTGTGQTWSGRGLQPNWLKAALVSGRKLEDFNV